MCPAEYQGLCSKFRVLTEAAETGLHPNFP